MNNTGKKIYTLLVQINTTTGQPTGLTKPNVPSDPDYIPPIYDPVSCPLVFEENSKEFSNEFDNDFN